MNDETCLPKSMDILITERCNGACPHCINRRTRGTAEMSISTFSSLCELLSNLGTKQVRLMGGEPTFHKDFSVFCETAQKTFPRVVVLTNAMNDHISRFCPREQDRIVYN
ncbi:MAG: radical SAM protein, partial [Bacteroidales bacterium]|nr:radical SAM protein [Bacteroidales bacterium]